MKNTAELCRAFIRDNLLYGQETTLDEDDSFLEAGLIDSTGVLELVTFIEQTFGFRLEDHELVPENLDSINRIVRFVARRAAAAPAVAVS